MKDKRSGFQDLRGYEGRLNKLAKKNVTETVSSNNKLKPSR